VEAQFLDRRCEMRVEVEVIGHVVRMRLHDQQVRRPLDHRLQHAARDAEPALQRLERFGRAGQENAEPAAAEARPGALRLIFTAVRLGGVGAGLDEAAPLAAAGRVPVVAHVAPDAALAVPQRAPAVGLERVRRDGREETARAREDAADGGGGDLHV
jgi:hypothetical protein